MKRVNNYGHSHAHCYGCGSHCVSYQDPVMAGSFAATATTLVAGSLIPDGDTVLKLKDNATYISHHRGITHSIPFTILWPILITFLIFVILIILSHYTCGWHNLPSFTRICRYI